jgi:hypothetical protein
MNQKMSFVSSVDQCTVCYSSIRSLECGHFICKPCIVKSGKQLCPICKADVKLTDKQKQDCVERAKKLFKKSKSEQEKEDYEAALQLSRLATGEDLEEEKVQPQREDTLLDRGTQSAQHNLNSSNLSINGPSIVLPNTVKIDKTSVNFTQKFSIDTLLPQMVNLYYAISTNQPKVESNIASLKAFGIAASIDQLCKDIEISPIEFAEILRDFYSMN